MTAVAKIHGQFRIRIEIKKGPHEGGQFEFDQETISIGRGPENDIVLADDVKVSRKHAEIRKNSMGCEIVNLSEKNQIYIDGDAIQIHQIINGQKIILGTSNLLIYLLEDTLSAHAASALRQPEVPVTSAVSFLKTEDLPANPKLDLKNVLQINPLNLHPKLKPNAQTFPRPPAAAISMQGRRPVGPSTWDNPRVRFYGLVVIVGVVIYILIGNSTKVARKPGDDLFRDSEKIQQQVLESEENTKKYKLRGEAQESVQVRRAQEHLVKGMRDFRQGQYGRARESFQLVLNLDPSNQVARWYYEQSKIRFDEIIKFHMMQGMSYREKGNFRLCRASFANAMKMISNKNSALYKESEQFLKECDLAMVGRF